MNMRYHYSYGAPNDLLDVLIGGMIVEIIVEVIMFSLFLLVVGGGKDLSTMPHPVFTKNAAFSF